MVAKTFLENMIVGSLTYHGGTETISYPWGSFNHLDRTAVDESPDATMLDSMGQAMLAASRQQGKPDFMMGTLTDTVYACYGAMEDWAYGAGWDTTPGSYQADCQP